MMTKLIKASLKRIAYPIVSSFSSGQLTRALVDGDFAFEVQFGTQVQAQGGRLGPQLAFDFEHQRETPVQWMHYQEPVFLI